ncbi:MAG: hypothetical protein R2715_18015 [Ilumatobacteraceae bacterium]
MLEFVWRATRRQEPITSLADLVDVSVVFADRLAPEGVAVVVLDAEQRPVAGFSVFERNDPGWLGDAIEAARQIGVLQEPAGSIVLVSVRPGDDRFVAAHDADRWATCTAEADAAGWPLLEWIVATPRSMILPRERAGVSSRLGVDAPPG